MTYYFKIASITLELISRLVSESLYEVSYFSQDEKKNSYYKNDIYDGEVSRSTYKNLYSPTADGTSQPHTFLSKASGRFFFGHTHLIASSWVMCPFLDISGMRCIH